MNLLVVVLVCLAGLLAMGGVLLVLFKLGVIAYHYTKPEPEDEGDGHTLAQSREPGQATSTPKDGV